MVPVFMLNENSPNPFALGGFLAGTRPWINSAFSTQPRFKSFNVIHYYEELIDFLALVHSRPGSDRNITL
jgi:hypothetical protein